MTGHSKSIDAFNSVLWADAELGPVDVDYDNFSFSILESTGVSKRIVCEGYLGYELVGFWDEIIIATGKLNTTGSFLDRCMLDIARRIGAKRLPSGSEARNREHGLQLVVTFLDGCELNIAMQSLRIDQIE
jgi:hypothetical protein